MYTITEQAKSIPVIGEYDICVLGGSTTGVSAAVRAARLGAKVAIVEKLNCFGGCATAGLFCVWDSLYDTTFEKQIIAGITQELIERLKEIPNALNEEVRDPSKPYRMSTIMQHRFNTEELKIELDKMVTESGIKPYLHTFYTAPYVVDGKLEAVFIENKLGRGAIKAKVFIDATADGDLCVHLGLESYKNEPLQPATTCCKAYGWGNVPNADSLILEHSAEYGINNIGWDTFIPGLSDVRYFAKTNIVGNCSDGNELTDAEIEGRRQIRAMMDLLRKYGENGDKMVLLALSSQIAIRETRQIKCQYQLKFEDVSNGKKFDDAVVNCAYPPDIHHVEKSGATYWYLDGLKEYTTIGKPKKYSRWREESSEYPTFWQIPYRSLVPGKFDNVLVCGRAIDADKGAFSAARSMISMNQTGEATGVAAFESLTSGKGVDKIDLTQLRQKMAQGGSIVF